MSKPQVKFLTLLYEINSDVVSILKVNDWKKKRITKFELDITDMITKIENIKPKQQVVKIKHTPTSKRHIKIPSKDKKIPPKKQTKAKQIVLKQPKKAKKKKGRKHTKTTRMTEPNGNSLTEQQPTLPETPETDVYILELQDNKIYVGKSNNVEKRIDMHLTAQGSVFTKAYKPTGKRLPRLGNIASIGDAAERDETLRYMYVHGIQNVRGWKYTSIHLSKKEIQEAEENIREMFDLCRRCGRHGHFITDCKQDTDRYNTKLEKHS
jgi:predicted GIY-YIG superfamily endonuclease